MKLKTRVAILLGQLASKVLSLTGGGSSFPGKLAEKIDKDILKNLSSAYETVMVTGTNGKTLTTALIANIIRLRDGDVLTNPSGANLRQGIITTFITSPSRKRAKVAVLEIDEATLKYITPHIKPKYIVFTNVFRDQMDRYGEIYTTYNEMILGASKAPEAIILANGDLPIFNSKALINLVKYFGFNHEIDGDYLAPNNADGIICPKCEHLLKYRQLTYANQGKYYCPYCEFSRPKLSYQVSKLGEMTVTESNFEIDNTSYMLPVAGFYNIYNALAAYAVAKELGLNEKLIRAGFGAIEKVFGRQERIFIEGKEVILNIMKNPVGVNQLIDLIALEKEPLSLVLLLNDRAADGTDISWIWDGNFEKLVNLGQKPFVLSGLRVLDLKKRIEVAGVDESELITTEDLSKLSYFIKGLPSQKVYLLATYTAMLDLRKVFKEQGYLKEGK